MMSRRFLVVLLAFVPSACGRDERATQRVEPPPPAASPDCGALTGANIVQTEMRQLECTLQLVVAAIGRDDLAAIPPAIATLHRAKQATEAALQSSAYKPANGDVAAFVALDEAFHESLVTLYEAAEANDHAATAAAMGPILGACQGCHATFRPTAPPKPSTPAPPPAHAH